MQLAFPLGFFAVFPGWYEVAPLALNGCFYPARFHAYCPPVHHGAIPIR